jgi:P2-related tail formation protein
MHSSYEYSLQKRRAEKRWVFRAEVKLNQTVHERDFYIKIILLIYRLKKKRSAVYGLSVKKREFFLNKASGIMNGCKKV